MLLSWYDRDLESPVLSRDGNVIHGCVCSVALSSCCRSF
jgi:hypothetical protein